MFTLTDKTLLDRAARMINASAKALRLEHEERGWASTEAGKKAKQEYDRLLRDERDMRALGKRLCAHFDVKAERFPKDKIDTAPYTEAQVERANEIISYAHTMGLAGAHGTSVQDTAEMGDPLNPLSPEARADYLSDLGLGSNRDFSHLQFDVSRETSAGNPQSTSGPQGDTVEAQPHLGGEDVGF